MQPILIITTAANLKNYVPVDILTKLKEMKYFTVLAKCCQVTQRIGISLRVLYNTIVDLPGMSEEHKNVLRIERDSLNEETVMEIYKEEYEECISEIV